MATPTKARTHAYEASPQAQSRQTSGSRGIRAPLRDQEKPIVRTYLRVTDIEKAVEKAALLGGKIALEPVEIPGQGKIAIYRFGGVEQGLWQVQ